MENVNCHICGSEVFDEDDFCEQCGAEKYPVCGNCGSTDLDFEDFDQHCRACGSSQRVCEGCGDIGGETCIACDVEWCADCWNTPEHNCNRAQVVA